MAITITIAIILSVIALALFVRARGLVDEKPVDHDRAKGSPARNQNLAIGFAIAAAIAWAIGIGLG